MKKIFTALLLVLASIGNAMAYDAWIDDDVDFTGFNTSWNGSQINWDGNYIKSFSQNGLEKFYYCKLTGDYRVSVSSQSGWQIGQSSEHNNVSYLQRGVADECYFYIHNLKAGDIVKVWLQGTCTLESGNTATGTQTNPNTGDEEDIINATGSSLGDGQVLKIVENGTVAIKLASLYAGIRYIDIEVRHEATYTITTNNSTSASTFKFTGDGVFTDKHAAVPYLNVSFGSDNNLTYVKKINNDYGSTSVSTSGNEYTEFTNNVPAQGTYYYFFPEVSGTITIKGYRNNNNWSVFFSQLEDNSYTNIYQDNNNYYIEYSQRIEKGKSYYISTNAYTADWEHTIFNLTEYTFTPDFTGVYHGPLSYVTTHGATSVADATQWATGLERVAIKACLGNIESASIEINGGQLAFTNITYKDENTTSYHEKKNGALITSSKTTTANQGGAVLVYMNPKYTNGSVTGYDDIFVLTVPYAAEQYADRDTKQVKVWNFYDFPLALGKSTDENSLLYKEMHRDNGKSDWTYTYLNLHNNTEPVFKNAYVMEGDNADMIAETEGLIFNTGANVSCIYNELDYGTLTEFHDRYVGLFNGGSFTIPRLDAGDYIRIKMNRYGSSSNGAAQAILKITGGTDIIGNTIGNDYSIGGSAPFENSDKCFVNGEYNFISTGGDFTVEVVDAALLKLYTIEIYKNTDFVSNNGVLGDGRSFLYVDNDAAVTRSINLHHRGKGESIKCVEQTGHTGTFYDDVNKTGKDIVFIEPTDPNNTYITSLSWTPQPNVDFGSVRVKIGCMTMNGKYVTDYDYWGLTVGYRKTQPYPYTWDFTDLSSRVMSEDNGMTAEQSRNPDNRVWYDYSSVQTGNYHRVGDLTNKGGRFAQGGQLYAGSKMILETEGLGMNMSNVDPIYNDGMQIVNKGGLVLNSKAGADWWRHRIEIPHVPADAVVYLRVKKLPADEVVSGHFYAGYSYGSWVRNSNEETAMTDSKSIATVLDIHDRDVTENDEEYTYIIPGSAESESENITIYLNGVILKKIAVSKDHKTVNQKGYASESRNRVIDHSLTSYFTGKPIKAYMAKNYNATKKTIDLVEITSPMPAASANGDIAGCVLYNSENKNDQGEDCGSIDVYNGGFNLFVPDMHDYTGDPNYPFGKPNSTSGESGEVDNSVMSEHMDDVEDMDGNLMKAFNVGGTDNAFLPATTSNGYTRYVLNWKYKKLDSDGNIIDNTQIPGEEAFYRVATNANNGSGASMKPNSAYIEFQSNQLPAKISFDFEDIFEEGIATPIEEVQSGDMNNENGTFYTLSGTKINRPTQSGLYIKNGKKVYVK